MQVRLGFAVAAHLDPEILLVDEVLAVGDASFQQKSLGRMHDAARAGRTVVFVSHDLGAIGNLTSKCLYLESGQAKGFGPTREMVGAYLSDSLNVEETTSGDLTFYRRSGSGDAPLTIERISCGTRREGRQSIAIGEPLAIDIGFDVVRPIEGVSVTAILKDGRGQSIAILYSPDSAFTLSGPVGPASVQLRVADLPLAPGTYYVSLGVNQSPATVAYDLILDYPLLEVVNTGQVDQWLERPWGAIHPKEVSWRRVN
jgi:energy-coupling factor transporter ATP-binding protein EcfA2